MAEYLGERFQISYAPSATVLLGIQAFHDAGGRPPASLSPIRSIVAAVGEVAAIGSCFPVAAGSSRIRLASESDVKAAVRDYDIVHLSVHGKFNAAEPMLSYVALAPAAVDDGRLTAAEMFGLPLDNSRLVVLSACETGRAEATHANEIIGLVRALDLRRRRNAGAVVLGSRFRRDGAVDAELLPGRAHTPDRRGGARWRWRASRAIRAYSHPLLLGSVRDGRPIDVGDLLQDLEPAIGARRQLDQVQRRRQLRALRVRLSGGPVSSDGDRRRHRSRRCWTSDTSLPGARFFVYLVSSVPSMLLIILPIALLLGAREAQSERLPALAHLPDGRPVVLAWSGVVAGGHRDSIRHAPVLSPQQPSACAGPSGRAVVVGRACCSAINWMPLFFAG